MESETRLEATDIVCAHCNTVFVVECDVEPTDKPCEQVIVCPSCGKANHRTLSGFQVNWFQVDEQISAITLASRSECASADMRSRQFAWFVAREP